MRDTIRLIMGVATVIWLVSIPVIAVQIAFRYVSPTDVRPSLWWPLLSSGLWWATVYSGPFYAVAIVSLGVFYFLTRDSMSR